MASAASHSTLLSLEEGSEDEEEEDLSSSSGNSEPSDDEESDDDNMNEGQRDVTPPFFITPSQTSPSTLETSACLTPAQREHEKKKVMPLFEPVMNSPSRQHPNPKVKPFSFQYRVHGTSRVFATQNREEKVPLLKLSPFVPDTSVPYPCVTEISPPPLPLLLPPLPLLPLLPPLPPPLLRVTKKNENEKKTKHPNQKCLPSTKPALFLPLHQR